MEKVLLASAIRRNEQEESVDDEALRVSPVPEFSALPVSGEWASR
jgi:hypothetical protein